MDVPFTTHFRPSFIFYLNILSINNVIINFENGHIITTMDCSTRIILPSQKFTWDFIYLSHCNNNIFNEVHISLILWLLFISAIFCIVFQFSKNKQGSLDLFLNLGLRCFPFFLYLFECSTLSMTLAFESS